MRRTVWMIALAYAALVLAQPVLVLADLRDDVGQAVATSGLQRGNIAISISDCESNATLVSINAGQKMIPASNMKLLTSGAALHYLGARFEFSTRMVRDGDRLIVIGDGDPGFGDPDLLALMTVGEQQGLDVEAFLAFWVNAVKSAGIKNIREVIVDDRVFDREFVHPSWPIDQLNRTYCAQVSGLTFHANIVRFYPRPDSSGRPTLSSFEPSMPWLFITNRGTCKNGSHDINDAWIARKIGTNELTLHGNVRSAYREPTSAPVTIHDMPAQFAQLLADRLQRAGVTVGGFRVAAADDPTFEGATIGPVITTPISTVITRCNRDSANFYAECLLKRTGHAMTRQPGSWLNGAAILRYALHERLGGSAIVEGLVVADGSGLSRDNRVTAELLTAWLNTFHQDERLGQIFIDSLASPGDEGTLERRFHSTKLYGASIHAKSGYINQVSCLSGYVTAKDGRRRSFSVLVNGLKPSEVRSAKALQEKIVAAIAEDLDAVRVSIGSD